MDNSGQKRGEESCLSTFPQDGRAWQGHAKKVNHVWLVSGALNIPDTLLTGGLHAIFFVKLSEEAQLLDFLLCLEHCVTVKSSKMDILPAPKLSTERYLYLPGNGRE